MRNGTDNARRPETMRVTAVPLAELFARFRVPSRIDLMSLDVEGAEALVMATFPFATTVRPAAIARAPWPAAAAYGSVSADATKKWLRELKRSRR